MTVDSLVTAAREQRLVSTGMDGVKSWLEAHETMHGAVEKVARPFAGSLKSLVGVADKAIGLSVNAVETNVYKPVVEKNGDFTLSGAVGIANDNMAGLAKTTYTSVQKKVSSAINYVIPDDPADSSSPETCVTSRIKSRASHLVDTARDVSQKLPIDVVGVADVAVGKSKSLCSTTYQNARSAFSLTTKTAKDALRHAARVGFFALPKEVGVVGLQTVGLLSRGPEYDAVRHTVGDLFLAYKRLVFFHVPQQSESTQTN